ncbi:MAG: class I SAM-dependent methyltransferase [Cytophagia bacterium]|nr:class I SAM-dependent methyltransferase [Cytophagia bacterium]
MTRQETKILNCPFTNKPLVPMTEAQLEVFNKRVSSGELYFYPGIKVESHVENAYITENQTYVYPEVKGVLLLKKDTAITTKNRTKNPLLRISDIIIDEFFNTYSILREGAQNTVALKNQRSQALSHEELAKLKALLPKTGDCLFSAVTHDTDALHNLVFNTDFKNYVHFDFSLDRLLAIRGEVKTGTTLVLCDMLHLPFAEGSVDALISFDYINDYDKAEQTAAYEELKRILKDDGSCVLLFDESKSLYAQNKHKSEQMTNKAFGVLAPWKKTKLPKIHFHPVQVTPEKDNKGIFVGKLSLGRQVA